MAPGRLAAAPPVVPVGGLPAAGAVAAPSRPASAQNAPSRWSSSAGHRGRRTRPRSRRSAARAERGRVRRVASQIAAIVRTWRRLAGAQRLPRLARAGTPCLHLAEHDRGSVEADQVQLALAGCGSCARSPGSRGGAGARRRRARPRAPSARAQVAHRRATLGRARVPPGVPCLHESAPTPSASARCAMIRSSRSTTSRGVLTLARVSTFAVDGVEARARVGRSRHPRRPAGLHRGRARPTRPCASRASACAPRS